MAQNTKRVSVLLPYESWAKLRSLGTHREMTAQALLAPMLIKWLQQECSDEGLS